MGLQWPMGYSPRQAEEAAKKQKEFKRVEGVIGVRVTDLITSHQIAAIFKKESGPFVFILDKKDKPRKKLWKPTCAVDKSNKKPINKLSFYFNKEGEQTPYQIVCVRAGGEHAHVTNRTRGTVHAYINIDEATRDAQPIAVLSDLNYVLDKNGVIVPGCVAEQCQTSPAPQG